MRKKLFGMLGALFAAALCAAAFTACDITGGDDAQTGYTITFADTENYTLTVKNGSGDDAETITSGTAVEAGTYIYVTAETTSYATYIDKVYRNGRSCSKNTSGQYYFAMPEESVTITAETEEYVETLEDSRAEFTSTDTTITKDGTNTSGNNKIWEFTVELSWSQYGSLSSSSEVTSSDQSVIPDGAITLSGGVAWNSYYNTGTATITIDTSMINAGYTYLTIYLNNSNTQMSSTNRSTLYVLVHVVEAGE